MLKEKKDYIAILAFGGLLIIIVLANLSQSKDTAKFITLESPQKKTIGEEKSESDVIRELMETTLSSVAPGGSLSGLDPEELNTYVFSEAGEIKDVTDGVEIKGVSTKGDAKGTAQAVLKDNNYYLLSKFQELPTPPVGFYWEGWVVRQKPFRYESTGKLEKINDVYLNYFGSTKDLIDHNYYVVTLEPDDNDVAPADHILEGKLFAN